MARALIDERRYQVWGYVKVEDTEVLRWVNTPSVWAVSEEAAVLKVEEAVEGFRHWVGSVEVSCLSEARWMEARGERTLFDLRALIRGD